MSEAILEMERFDVYWGRVTDHSRSGVYIELSNGATVYSYDYAPDNSVVLCSVKNLADVSRGRRYPAVRIDSIRYEVCA